MFFGDIPDVHIIADDLIVASLDEKQHDKTLHDVMQRAKSMGCKFNKEKIKFKKSELHGPCDQQGRSEA